MIYVLTEWNGKGSGDVTLVINEKNKAMAERQCTLTYKAAIKKYGKTHFMGPDVKCSTIDSYASKKAINEGRPKTTSNWY